MKRIDPLISIIIPSFNSKRFIDDAIRSARDQSFRNIEIIVVDEHSKDGTVEMIRRHEKEDTRVRYADQTGEKGPARARNQGLEMAKGKYATFFDSDNILLSDACETIAGLVKQNGESDVYFGELRYFESDEPDRLLKFTVQHVTNVTIENLIRQNFINLLGTFIKRDILSQFGGFDNRFRTCEEHILWLRLTLWANATFRHVPKVLGHLRFHATNLTWRPSYFVEAAETNFVIYDWLEQELEKKLREKERKSLMHILQAERAKWLFRAGLGGLVMKDRKLAEKYFEKWYAAANVPAWKRAMINAGVSLAPLRAMSPAIMWLRRKVVMRRYVTSTD